MLTQTTTTSSSPKSGLIRSFIVVVFGILFLSFIGFDLRGEVTKFQENNSESITSVKQVLFETIIPKTKDSVDSIKEFADENDITVENAKKTLDLLNEYKDVINFEEYGITLPENIQKTPE